VGEAVLGLAHLGGGVVADADRFDASSFVFGGEGFHQGRLAHEKVEGPMDLIQGDFRGAEAIEAGGEGIVDCGFVGAPGEGEVLGGEADLGAVFLPRLAEQGGFGEASEEAFGFAEAVDFGGVEEGDAPGDRGGEGCLELGFVVVLAVAPKEPIAPGPGPDAEGGDDRAIWAELTGAGGGHSEK
jgi:hypothetical protein